MITLRGKLKKDGEVSNSKATKDFNKRASVRDKLLVKEVTKLTEKVYILAYTSLVALTFTLESLVLVIIAIFLI